MVDKAIWFYIIEDRKEGPVSHQALQTMLDKEEIDVQTEVWTESLGQWFPISELEHFNLSTLDETPMIEIKNQNFYQRESDCMQTKTKPRPWIRFWARMFDYNLLFFVIILGELLIDKHLITGWWQISYIFLWVFIESIFLSTWGTTPGKYIFKTFVRNKDHQRLRFSDALNRSFSVWWIGLAAGIPFISTITMIVAAFKLSYKGDTSWDRCHEYRIFHEKIGWKRACMIITCFLCLMVIIGKWNFTIFGLFIDNTFSYE